MTQPTDQHSSAAGPGDQATAVVSPGRPGTAAPPSGLPDDPERHRDGHGRVGGNAGSGGNSGLVPVLAFAGITVAVMQTLLVPVIKDLPTLLDTSASNATWVMTATLLAGAVSTPIMGRLGDLYGKRRMLLASLAVMVVGSLICGFTSSLVIMIVGRALQGFAMGAIPLGIGLMRDELPPARLGGAMALMSSSIGVGGGLALPGAALVAQHLDWHALFFTAAGLGVLAILLTLLRVPESKLRATGRFDLAGAIGLSVGLILLLLPITKGADWGWGSPTTLGLFGAGVAVLVLWGLMELRLAAPLVDLRTTARRVVLLTNLASIMIGVAFYAISLVLPQLLQLPVATGYGLGQSMVSAGLCVAPLGLTMMLTAPLYAKISAQYGPKVSLIIGMLIIGIGYGAGLGLMSAAWQTIVISVIVGAGIGLAYSSLPALIIGAVDASETGAANGLNTLMRSIGTSVSSAVIGMVLANTSQPMGGVAVPTMQGFRTAFLIATAAVAGGLILAICLPARQPSRHPHLRASSQDGIAPGTEDTLPSADAPVPALVAVGADGQTSDAPLHTAPALDKVVLGAPAPGALTLDEPAFDAAVSGSVAPAAMATAVPAAAPAVRADEVTAPVAEPAGAEGALHGRVLDAVGAPVARAKVTLIDGRGRQAGAALTDAHGRYALDVPHGGSYVLAARAAGHAPHASATTHPGNGARTEATISLPAIVPAPRTVAATTDPTSGRAGTDG
ncbi:MFS transporter [Streptomyces odontomachi]|uniref:MFS transporter n=1 Tax=Streptomyces odontomachi TaxID=2944940 RepID=UPI0021096D67|nr:MFS transporter [Streptomyces sp. ODS25]